MPKIRSTGHRSKMVVIVPAAYIAMAIIFLWGTRAGHGWGEAPLLCISMPAALLAFPLIGQGINQDVAITIGLGASVMQYAILGYVMDRLSSSRERKGLCKSCGYNLTGNVSGRCPECGQGLLENG